MSEKKIQPSRLRGVRVEDSGSFPDEQEAYRDMTPAERIEALRTLSKRLYAITGLAEEIRRQHPGIPDRLIGGRHEHCTQNHRTTASAYAVTVNGSPATR